MIPSVRGSIEPSGPNVVGPSLVPGPSMIPSIRGSIEQAGMEQPLIDVDEPTGNFILTAPRSVRENRPYSASIHILNPELSQVKVEIQVENGLDEVVGSGIALNVDNHAPQTITIPNIAYSATDRFDNSQSWRRHQYYLRVKGTANNKLIFHQRKSLNFDSKSESVFIQTDKAQYKPGDKIRMRAVVMTPDVKPYVGDITLKILDPARNLIKQWVDQKLDKGVVSAEFQLSEEPPLGNWQIELTGANDLSKTKYVTIEKYVLPKFEVTLTPPPFISKDDNAEITVEAKYTFGKGVQGPVTLSLQEPSRWCHRNRDRCKTCHCPDRKGITKTAELDAKGQHVFKFSNAEMKEVELIQEYSYTTSLALTAQVTEELTGITRNVTGNLQIYKETVNIELRQSTNTFKPDLDYQTLLSVTYRDGTPISPDLPRTVQIREVYSYTYETLQAFHNKDQCIQTIKVKLLDLEKDGTKILSFRPPNGTLSMRIEARYTYDGKTAMDDSNIMAATQVSAAQSPTNTYMQLQATTTEAVPVGQTLTVNVRTTNNVPAVIAQVYSRGRLVFNSKGSLSNGLGSVKIPVTAEMAPTGRLVVYSVLSDNHEVVVDVLDFKVDGLFDNKVSLSLSADTVGPGEPVLVTVSADADSLVALSAVDQSVLLLGDGNDMHRDKVEAEIATYSSHGGVYYDYHSRWYSGIGGRDPHTVFSNAGVVVATDAWLYIAKTSPPGPPIGGFGSANFRGDMMESAPMASAAGPMPAPGAPPVADSSRISAGDSAGFANQQQPPPPPPTTRKDFPETWIWTDLVASNNGSVVYSATAPDTITSWSATAFASNEVSGFGISKDYAKLKVFRPFFIRLNLPYSVKRQEKMALQVLVFNYEETEQKVTVTLDHDKQNAVFEFVQRNGDLLTAENTKPGYNTRVVTVAAGDSTTVFFPIQPTKVGDHKLKVTAIGTTTSDALEKVLIVEPEGYRVDRNAPMIVDLSQPDATFVRSVALEFPDFAVPESEKAEVNVAGDLLGPVMSNLDQLVRMPYGCGEQNMVNLVPNIVVMNYLTATRREDPALKAAALNYMQSGYQRQLNYKRPDGSFSAFGSRDDSGSTWLTAFVVRTFKQAEKYINVDEGVMKKAIEFLQNTQLPLRRDQKEAGVPFVEFGKVHNQYLQGGASNGEVAMTAYVSLALLENNITNPAAINFIVSNLANVSDEPYSLAVAAYVLHLADNPAKEQAFQLLMEHVSQEAGETFWSDTVGDTRKEGDRLFYSSARSVDVEMTSYALLTVMLRKDLKTAAPIVRWLTKQRNGQGGWASTQDTVMALQALAVYGAETYVENFDVTVTVQSGDKPHTFSVTPQNALVWQQYEIADPSAPVELSASGSGVVFAQVQWRYHTTRVRDDVPFKCDKTVYSEPASSDITLELCCRYAKPGKQYSNMAVLEVNSLSGFEFDIEQLQELTAKKSIHRVETANSATRANVYITELTKTPLCTNITSTLAYTVSNQKDASMVLYDYYENSDRIDMQYGLMETKDLATVCPDCWKLDV